MKKLNRSSNTLGLSLRGGEVIKNHFSLLKGHCLGEAIIVFEAALKTLHCKVTIFPVEADRSRQKKKKAYVL